MVSIQRRDNKMWAIPGGMVDPGETMTTTLKREFIEETLNGRNGNRVVFYRELVRRTCVNFVLFQI